MTCLRRNPTPPVAPIKNPKVSRLDLNLCKISMAVVCCSHVLSRLVPVTCNLVPAEAGLAAEGQAAASPSSRVGSGWASWLPLEGCFPTQWVTDPHGPNSEETD